MTRLNVYLPDELAATVRATLPELNVSAVLQRGLQAALECRHHRMVCADCAAPVDHRELIDDALSSFFVDLYWKLHELVDKGGSAEGAARIAKEVGGRHRVAAAARMPLPRASRAQHRAQRVVDLPDTASA
jgi:post-segregation antitoxin (ccd killing protein)